MPGYVDFTPKSVGPNKVTKEWYVTGRNTANVLGHVRFYAWFRKYTFHPEPDTLFDGMCLEQIAAFLTEQTEIQRAEAKERKANA